MRKSAGIVFLVILIGITTLLGCADLKTINFAGEIPLAPRETIDLSEMLELGETTISSHWQLSRDLLFRPSSLNDYLATLIWERAYRSRDAYSFAKDTWICDIPYIVTTSVDRRGKIFHDLAGKDDRDQVLKNLKWEDSGDPWWQSFDFKDEQWDSSSLSHRAVLTDCFTAPGTAKDFLIRSQYRFDVDCKQEFYDYNGQQEIDQDRSYVDAKLTTTTYVGYSWYLSGEKTFLDQKKRKATITVTMIDRNLDGQFTEDDGTVTFNISNSFYFRNHVPLGKPFKLDSKSNTSYLLHLIRKPDGGYSLDIQPAL